MGSGKLYSLKDQAAIFVRPDGKVSIAIGSTELRFCPSLLEQQGCSHSRCCSRMASRCLTPTLCGGHPPPAGRHSVQLSLFFPQCPVLLDFVNVFPDFRVHGLLSARGPLWPVGKLAPFPPVPNLCPCPVARQLLSLAERRLA